MRKLSYKEAQQYAKRLEEAWKVAYINLKKAQKLIEQQANKYRRKPNFTIGNIVQVIIKNQKIERPSYKLDYKIVGLYKILNKVGNLYKVKGSFGGNFILNMEALYCNRNGAQI